MAKPLVLIVEDDPKPNEIISITLQADFIIDACEDGGKALELLRTLVPQLVVLDLNLPETTGANILSYIRSEERMA